jgi:hypothetical protein
LELIQLLKQYLSILVIVLLNQCKTDVPDTITIPDVNFLNALIQLGIDTDGDGKISPAEAETVRSLDISDRNISDITGISSFISLDTLTCTGNWISVPDVSKNVGYYISTAA